jgi:hypothetical protein
MAKRGPGKFDSDLDAAIYSLSLDGTADEEASYGEVGGAYLLFRNGGELADAIEERRKFAPEEVERSSSSCAPRPRRASFSSSAATES